MGIMYSFTKDWGGGARSEATVAQTRTQDAPGPGHAHQAPTAACLPAPQAQFTSQTELGGPSWPQPLTRWATR